MLTQEEIKTWLELVAECRSGKKTIDVGSDKRRSVIIRISHFVFELGEALKTGS